MKIIVKSPCRLSLAGGGTDVNPFASLYGGLVLNFSIGLFHRVELKINSNAKVRLEVLNKIKIFPVLPNFIYGQEPDLDLIYAILNFFKPKIPSGFNLKIISPTVNPVGLGRSASASVAVIAAFNAWLNFKLDRLAIGLLASRLEVEELGWLGGKQDGLSAAYGGVNFMAFGPGEKIEVRPIKMPKNTLREFENYLIMFEVGGEHQSGQQQKILIQGMAKADKLAALAALKQAVMPAQAALKQADWQKLGKILDIGWQNKKNSNLAISNPKIDKIYNLAISDGAYGGKLAGSGGAGYLFFICPPKKQVRLIRQLAKFKIKPTKIKLDFKGVQVKIC